MRGRNRTGARVGDTPRRRACAVALGLAAALAAVACGSSAAGVPSRAAPAPGEPATAPEAIRPEALHPEAIRPDAAGLHGAVVAGHPLAAAAGYEVLRAGGNAVDAAVTMAAVLAVVRPHMNGVGGDAFALFYEADARRVTALNASGRAAALATPGYFRERGLEDMPGSGPLSITVPGAVSAWAGALARYGTLPLARALEPAIALAEDGFVVTETLARDLSDVSRLNEAGRRLYAPRGEPLTAGDVLRNPALARTLRDLAAHGPEALYGGRVGQALAAFLEAEGSPLRAEDFAAHRPEWAEPVSLDVFGHRVHTVPPNSQGMVLLQTLGIAERALPDGAASLSVDALHTLVEAKKLAFADRDRWLADPATDPPPVARLLDPEYLAARARVLTERAAEGAQPGFGGGAEGNGREDDSPEGDGDTVYLIAVDRDGNAVSWIQSLFSSFGSGLVDPGTGIVLQNRGAGFTLAEGRPNRIAPGKRPFHTLMATMVTDPDGAFALAIGTPGGDGQSQTVAQGLLHLLSSGFGPQQAVEAPRFRSESGRTLLVESRLPGAVRAGLQARGHELRVVEGWTAPFGNLMVIRREPNGVLRTGADMRREGAALAY